VDQAEKIVLFSEKLRPFLPEGAEYYISKFIIENTVQFTVSKARKSKLGDYRQPWDGKPHRISVNGNLNRYAFLVTTIHEMAHLCTFDKYGAGVKSHGIEWKNEFKDLFQPIINKEILPTDITMAVNNYLRNAKAASCSDDRLYRVLRRYDENRGILVEHLEYGDVFEIKGKVFVLGKKLRKRYECKEQKSGKMFRVLGLAEVDEVLKSKTKISDAIVA
jgi:SprT protein